MDPRWPFAALLTLYCALGVTWLSFSRSPLQMGLTVAACCALDAALTRLLRGVWVLPLSAYISGLSLALLLNYSHTPWLLFLPVFFTVGSKFLFTVEGRHHFNPSLFGVVASLALSGELISTAPAYQWGGSLALSAFLVMAALSLFVFRVGRGWLVGSFLGFYVLQILLRAYVMRWHLPAETLLFGTLTSAPFFLFAFYMITDPATSPKSPREQVGVAAAIVVVDLLLHVRSSLYTFYYAAFFVAAARFAWRRYGAVRRGGFRVPRETLRAAAVLGALALAAAGVWRGVLAPRLAARKPAFRLEPAGLLPASVTGEALRLVDPRVAHVAKWVLSVGDAAAAGDFDGDGRLDLVLTQPLKSAADRLVLLRNAGGLRFERVPVPAFAALAADPVNEGLAANPVFFDMDGDGDQDLLVSVAFGRTRLYRNTLRESGRAGYAEAPLPGGPQAYTVSVTATVLDFDRDGRPDLLIGNVLDTQLRRYDPPRPLNIFKLPAAERPGDRRMFPFMHESWNRSANGGRNLLYRNLGGGRFEALDAAALGLPETHWTIAAVAGDLDRDGWPDLYLASDFGPDDVYLNRSAEGTPTQSPPHPPAGSRPKAARRRVGEGGEGGASAASGALDEAVAPSRRRFVRLQGRMFGSVGKDTYKGMNASLGDFDRNGWLDVHVSNVHMPLQAEGSLLWMLGPGRDGVPEFRDEATVRGALNEGRFGWGAAVGDLDLDGWPDMVQANGMVDDTLDKLHASCPDYWYVNEKVMRAPPEVHAYADLWGDIRGRCINPRDADRVYLSRGDRRVQQFEDASQALGFGPDVPSRGMLLADFDDDGDLDLLKTRMVAPGALYRNTLREDGGGRNWVGLSLTGDGRACNADAVGTRVVLRYEEGGRPVEQVREVLAVNGFSAQSDRRLLFGLGDFAGTPEAEVSWCGGAPVRLPLAPGRYHALAQGKAP